MTSPLHQDKDYFAWLYEQAEIDIEGGRCPPLCNHVDPNVCNERCERLAARFDAWARGIMKRIRH